MSDELPEGWATARPLELADLIRGVSYEKGEAMPLPAKGHVLLLRANNIADTGINFRDVQYVPRSRVSEVQLLRMGDVVIAMSSGSKAVVGKAASFKATEEAAFGAFCGTLRPRAEIDSRYFGLFFQTRTYRRGISELSAGTNINNLKREYFDEFDLPVAPLPEQRRIVDKVEALLTRVNAARDRLAKVPGILKRFRQSVLAAACSGRLTEDWRQQRGIVEVDGEQPWRSGPVNTLCTTVVDCPHSTPKWAAEGEICLRTTNFAVHGLDLSEVRFVSQETYRERVARLEPNPGDIVYSREGGILGIACVIPQGLRACLGQRMMLMRCNTEVIRPEFLCLALNSPAILDRVKELTGGTASPHLNVGDIKQFAIPVPTIEEQQEILSRVNALFGVADAIERRVTGATARADKLTQSILAKAFRGELVPTEAELARVEGREFESAAAMLDRLRTSNGHAAASETKKVGPREKRRTANAQDRARGGTR